MRNDDRYRCPHCGSTKGMWYSREHWTDAKGFYHPGAEYCVKCGKRTDNVGEDEMGTRNDNETMRSFATTNTACCEKCWISLNGKTVYYAGGFALCIFCYAKLEARPD